MSIQVACQCGGRFAAQPELAGSVVACPGCQQQIQVPAASPFNTLPPVFNNGSAASQPQASKPRPSAPASDRLGLAMAAAAGVLLLLTIALVFYPGFRAARRASMAASHSAMISRPAFPSFPEPRTTTTDPAAQVKSILDAMQRAAESANRSSNNTGSEPTPTTSRFWHRHYGDKFRMRLPKTPTAKSNKTPDGREIKSWEYIDDNDDAYVFGYVELGDTASVDVAAFLDKAVTQQLQAWSGKETGKTNITLEGFKGIEFSFDGEYDNKPLRGLGRLYFIEDRYYQLVWTGRDAAASKSDVDRFFREFRLTGHRSPSSSSSSGIRSGGSLSEDDRKTVYLEANRRIERTRKSIQNRIEGYEKVLEGPSGDIPSRRVWEQNIENARKELPQNIKRDVDSVGRSHRITPTDVLRILTEGDSKAWPKE